MARYVVLLRGVNVGGNRKLPMADLRTVLSDAGMDHVASYIQSGNLVLDHDGPAAAVESAVEGVIAARFGFACPAIARSAAEWTAYAAADPLPGAEPRMLHLALAKQPLLPGAADAIAAAAQHGERVVRIGDALWIDYGATLADSKLSPAILDRAAGSVVTARNRNTVTKLAAMAAA